MSELDGYAGVPESTLNDLGEGLCEVRDAAKRENTAQSTAEALYLKQAVETGLDAGDTGAFFVYATARFCPEYSEADKLSSLVSE